jgi:ubiquinone biosynthesis protein Coq4
MKRKCNATPVDLNAEIVIDGRPVKISLIIKPINELRGVLPIGQTVSGKFIFYRNNINHLEEIIQDSDKISCKKATMAAIEKAKAKIKERYTGSNVDIESTLAFIEETTTAWVKQTFG